MNFWRWLGLSMLLLGAMCLIGAGDFTVQAGAQDKGKDKDTKQEEKKPPEKGKEPVPQPPAKGALEFKAFDQTSYAKDKAYFYQEQHTNTKQTMKVLGQEVIQDQDQTFLIKWTVKEKEKDGTFVVTQEIVGVEMTINIGGNKITYSSKTPDANQPKNPMTDFFAQLRKNSLTFYISPDLTVKKIDDREKFIKELGAINPQMQGLLNAILSDDALKKMAEPTWYAYPSKGEIPASKTWQKKSELNLGPIGKYNTTFDFTHEKSEAGKDTIKIKTKLDYTAPADKAGLPFIIHSADLKTDSGTGTAVFDRKSGRFDSTEISMNLKGTLEIEVGSMKTKVDLDQKQTAKSTTSDDMPAKWTTAK